MGAADSPDEPVHVRRQWTPFAIVTAILIPLLAIGVSAYFGVEALTSDDKAATSTAGDSCLLGLWQINGQAPTEIDLTDGTKVAPVSVDGRSSLRFGTGGNGGFIVDFGVTGTSRGVRVEQVFDGVDSFKYTVDSHTVTLTKVADSMTQTTTVDGRQDSKTILVTRYGTVGYTCTPTTLILTYDATPDGTISLSRLSG